MITTITLNPAVDKTCTLKELIPGAVNRMEDVKNIAGGKGINVTKILRQYDYPVRALGFLGGYNGRFIEDYLKSIGAEFCFTYVNGETRCNTNVLSGDGSVTELLEPGPIVSKEELNDFLGKYEEALTDSEVIVISGSIPEGVPVTIYADLIRLAKEKGVKVCLDTSGEPLKEGIAASPFMIKPNKRELEALLNEKIETLAMLKDKASKLVRAEIDHVLVSMGNDGLLYANKKQVLFAKAPKVQAVNTVACGDSVVSSFVMSLIRGDDGEECLKKAVAISAANATTFDSAVIPKETAGQLYEVIEVQSI